ncbi:hypothetical protein [Williamsia sterculiae]|uniref:Uncharacterized protein n=1 Tax=Williamsia sterculiae TaxID=1344003 RepID=A0A1N7GVH5_9NOCA|nr:hypothetical protein [Williamsia sterculiae]SIS16556.1 hypothetical protein SAMN05445060_3132 [Williamsia sterculiae]
MSATRHRLDTAPGGLSTLVDRVTQAHVHRAARSVTLLALDFTRVHTDPSVAKLLDEWANQSASSAQIVLQAAGVRSRYDQLAFTRSEQGDPAGYVDSFQKARAMACLAYAAGDGGREALREVAYEGYAATGDAEVIASLLDDHTGL